MKIKVSNISWDTDVDWDNGDYYVPELPTETEVEVNSEDEIADKLSDSYGFLVNSFSID